MSESFILNFRHALDPNTCDLIIKEFDESTDCHVGRTGGGVDLNKKNSLDLAISKILSWHDTCTKLDDVVFDCLSGYVQTFPHLITGAVAPHIIDPQSQKPRAIRFDEIPTLKAETVNGLCRSMFRIDPWNLQRYEPRSGGYPHWHSEQFPTPNDPNHRALHRLLLVIIYLNDVNDGGATEFFYQNASIQPERGSLVLAPCGFTHTHRGAPSPSEAKYILATWVSYKSADALYQGV
jgi:hypothetical protein